MPIYEYECRKCVRRYELLMGVTADADPKEKCPKCKGKIHRVPSVANAVFKGGGFHCNDYPADAAPATTKGKRTKNDNIKRGIERVAKRIGKDNVL